MVVFQAKETVSADMRRHGQINDRESGEVWLEERG